MLGGRSALLLSAKINFAPNTTHNDVVQAALHGLRSALVGDTPIAYATLWLHSNDTEIYKILDNAWLGYNDNLDDSILGPGAPESLVARYAVLTS